LNSRKQARKYRKKMKKAKLDKKRKITKRTKFSNIDALKDKRLELVGLLHKFESLKNAKIKKKQKEKKAN